MSPFVAHYATLWRFYAKSWNIIFGGSQDVWRCSPSVRFFLLHHLIIFQRGWLLSCFIFFFLPFFTFRDCNLSDEMHIFAQKPKNIVFLAPEPPQRLWMPENKSTQNSFFSLFSRFFKSFPPSLIFFLFFCFYFFCEMF